MYVSKQEQMNMVKKLKLKQKKLELNQSNMLIKLQA